MPSPALGLGYTVATSLCLRARRFATMEPAARPAGLGSDLTSTACSSLGDQSLEQNIQVAQLALPGWGSVEFWMKDCAADPVLFSLCKTQTDGTYLLLPAGGARKFPHGSGVFLTSCVCFMVAL